IYYKILPLDFVPRVNYCEWFLHNTNDVILDATFFTDEAWFHLEGYNKAIARTANETMAFLRQLYDNRLIKNWKTLRLICYLELFENMKDVCCYL
ncbi:hypothetical protein BDFB_007888, partial [Asbolus verrucosus]